MPKMKKCPLWYDDECPHLQEDGYCELDHPEDDCDDYMCYAEDTEEEHN